MRIRNGAADDALPAGDPAKQFFESQLEGLHLSIDEINRQTLDELWESLERIGEEIENPAPRYVVLMTEAAKDAYDMNTIRPVLVERRELIQSRIRELRTLHAAHAESPFEDEAAPPQDKVATIHALRELAEALLTREPVASIVGGVLAWALGAAMIAAMFMKIDVSPNVSNAFVIVLGYFFVQSARGERAETGTKPTDTSPPAEGGE
jgi:hypothetical protein